LLKKETVIGIIGKTQGVSSETKPKTRLSQSRPPTSPWLRAIDRRFSSDSSALDALPAAAAPPSLGSRDAIARPALAHAEPHVLRLRHREQAAVLVAGLVVDAHRDGPLAGLRVGRDLEDGAELDRSIERLVRLLEGRHVLGVRGRVGLHDALEVQAGSERTLAPLRLDGRRQDLAGRVMGEDVVAGVDLRGEHDVEAIAGGHGLRRAAGAHVHGVGAGRRLVLLGRCRRDAVGARRRFGQCGRNRDRHAEAAVDGEQAALRVAGHVGDRGRHLALAGLRVGRGLEGRAEFEAALERLERLLEHRVVLLVRRGLGLHDLDEAQPRAGVALGRRRLDPRR
jgi:hypothetical protein